VTGGAAREWPPGKTIAAWSDPGAVLRSDWRHLLSDWRHLLSGSSGILLVVVLVPPVSGWARSYEWVQAIQFATLGVAVPALLVMGAPWRIAGLGHVSSRISEARRRHPEPARAVAFTLAELCGLVAWRTPAAVNWLAGGAWRALVEAGVLLLVGIGYWLELVESPPCSPRSTRPVRMAVAAAGMWTIWVLAYLVGLSHADWYRSYHHVTGTGLSLAADQQVTTGVLWAISACAFIPVIFWNLVVWLRSEEDPDQELHRLAKLERRRQAWQPTESRNKTVPPQI